MLKQTETHPDWYWLWYSWNRELLIELHLIRQIPDNTDWVVSGLILTKVLSLNLEFEIKLYLEWYWFKSIYWSSEFTTLIGCQCFFFFLTIILSHSFKNKIGKEIHHEPTDSWLMRTFVYYWSRSTKFSRTLSSRRYRRVYRTCPGWYQREYTAALAPQCSSPSWSAEIWFHIL